MSISISIFSSSEIKEYDLYAAAVEVLAVEGHEGAQEGIKGEYWDNNQSV